MTGSLRDSSLAGAGALALLCLVLFLLAGASSPAGLSSPVQEFQFQHDNVLGTSLDLIILAPGESAARACEQAVLDEIERLRLILSTYDSASEISRLNRQSGPVPCSAELIEVLRAYEDWARRSGGAFSGQLGELVRTWKEAGKADTLPDAAPLDRLVRQIGRPGWAIDDMNRRVTRLTDQPLNVNAIGKGYIIGRAAATARARVPTVRGLLLNIGGDILALGDGGTAGSMPWRIGVADPAHPEDNAAPLTELWLQDCAVATSAGYERHYTIGGRRWSHILDPRTGRPRERPAPRWWRPIT